MEKFVSQIVHIYFCSIFCFKGNIGFAPNCLSRHAQRRDVLMEEGRLKHKMETCLKEEIWKGYGEPQLLKRTVYLCALCLFNL